jgi:hypothetical protein
MCAGSVNRSTVVSAIAFAATIIPLMPIVLRASDCAESVAAATTTAGRIRGLRGMGVAPGEIA